MRHLLIFIIGLCLCSAYSCISTVDDYDPVPMSEDLEISTAPMPMDSYHISRAEYIDGLKGFWLGQCIANWTGLITEMDKIGNIGEIKTGDFYTREDWGRLDQPNIWNVHDSNHVERYIDFVLITPDEIWGADDDTDIEYMYQYLMHTHQATELSPNQIKEGWLKHIKTQEENYLWVSNQQAFDLMRTGILPPSTSDPKLNEHYEMIDAQLTTEIFGLFAPGQPQVALEIAHLPIYTTARENAAYISEFHVALHSLASIKYPTLPIKDRLHRMMEKARDLTLPDSSYAAKMYRYVQSQYQSGKTWEEARDSIYMRYQVNGEDGYDITSKNLYCNGCFAAGINFAAGLISLWYGEGDFKETIKIGTLMGWDSDNPTATWGGLLGFMHGDKSLQLHFDQDMSDQYNIHRTRQNFPNDGIDNFDDMAIMGMQITDRIITKKLKGIYNSNSDSWYIPNVNNGIE